MTGKDLACSLATCIVSLTASAYEKPQVCKLHTDWTFCQVGDTLWSDAKVPGTVHQDLLNHNRIPNPFYGMNEDAVQWVENADWMYRTSFVVDEHQLSRDAAVLEMDGLDTYADVFLNGALILRSDNMFVGHKTDDALLPNVTQERYKRIFEDVKAANVNMLRVWGGGIYEDDEFYDEADRNGILIWQDFMFACSSYPHDPLFVGRVESEAEYNIKRLRGHASLAMWCGNNEIYEAMRYWGWHRKYSAEAFAEMERGYDVLFRGLLPKMVERLDNGRFYMHSSPYEANWGRPDSWKIGDSHNWGTWHGRKPFESFDTDVPRFMSEYGFQAFPEMKTIRTFAEEKDFELESPVMNAHQKADIGNALIKKTMGLYYRVPEKFEDLVYVGLVLQGQGIRHGIEAHRRNRPYCMGSLFWQLNDSWPVVSWSSIDYYGNWKALMYQSKRAFAPILINAIKEGDDLCVYLVSDELNDRDNVRLNVELMDFDGKVHGKWTQNGRLAANSSMIFMKKRTDEWQGKLSAANSLLHFTLKDKHGATIADDVFYFAYPKDQKLPEANIETSVRRRGDAIEMTLKTDKLARDIFVEVPVQGVRFTDNFFDLLPDQRKKITITSPEGHSLNDFTFRLHQLGGVR